MSLLSHSPRATRKPVLDDLKLVASYSLLAGLWILASDIFVNRALTGLLHEEVDLGKGLFFILASAGFFFVNLRRRDLQWQRAEEALQLSEQRFRQMAESIQDAFWLSEGPDGRILYVSPAFEKIWGLGVREVIERPERWLETVHPKDRERVTEAWRRGAQVGVYDTAYRIVRPDGSLRWIHAEGFRVQGEDDTLRMAGVARDITQSKLREDAARETADRLELALEGSRTGVWEWEIESDRVYWSPEFLQFVGVSRMEKLRDFMDLVHPDDAGLLWQEVERSLATHENFAAEYRLRTGDGRIIWLASRGQLRCNADGKPLRMVGTCTDVTVRRESEEAYRGLFELSPEAILIQCEGRVRMVNAALVKLLGAQSPADLLDRPVLELIHPDSRPLVAERIRILNEELRPLLAMTRVMFKRVDGTDVEVETVAAPYVYRGLNGAQVVMRDITERTRSEQARADLAARLQEAQKMEAVGQLAGGVAHDFNNLLTVIGGNVTLLKRMQADAGLTTEIMEAVSRASGLTQQLLMFSRKKAMNRVPLSLSKVSEHTLKLLRRVLGEDVSLLTDLPGNLPLTLADEVMLEQVIMNLALNARDAMPQGGTLTLSTHEARFTAEQAEEQSAPAAGTYVCLTVRDSGAGIAPEILPHIFEPFFTTKSVGRGTGLGLATVYGIVQQHNGFLRVESAPGQGASFHVYFPAETESGPQPESLRPEATSSSEGHESILLVEDDPALRRLVNRILVASGYRVLVASNGDEALKLWSTCGPSVDMVLSDLVMPGGLNGLSLVEKLCQDRPDLKVLFTSGYSADLLDQRAANPGERRFLSKPYSPQRLTEAVRRCLDG